MYKYIIILLFLGFIACNTTPSETANHPSGKDLLGMMESSTNTIVEPPFPPSIDTFKQHIPTAYYVDMNKAEDVLAEWHDSVELRFQPIMVDFGGITRSAIGAHHHWYGKSNTRKPENGLTLHDNQNIVVNTRHRETIWTDNTSEEALLILENCHHILFKDIHFLTTTQMEYGLILKNCSHIYFQNCKIVGKAKSGLWINNSTEIHWEGGAIEDMQAKAVQIDSSAYVFFDKMAIENCRVDSCVLAINATNYVEINQCLLADNVGKSESLDETQLFYLYDNQDVLVKKSRIHYNTLGKITTFAEQKIKVDETSILDNYFDKQTE